MSINALNGLFAAFGGADKLGSRVGDAYNEMRLGAAMGAARRAAAAEGLALDNQLIEQDTGRVQLAKPDAVYDRQTARRFRQEEGPAAMVEVPQTEKKRRADVDGGANVEALYLTKFLPDQVKKLRDSGNAGLADRLEGYVSSETGQQHSKLYANMVKAHAAGNYDGAAKFMEQLQELSGEDTNATVMADGKGGYKMRLQNTAKGTAEDYELDESRLMGEMGMFAYMDPAKMVARFDTQEKAKAANLATVAKAKEETRRQLALKDLDFKYGVARDNLKYQQDIAKMIQQNNLDMSKPTDKQRVFEWLEKSGVPRAELDKYIAGIVEGRGGDGVRQAPNPTDVARQYIADQYKAGNDEFIALGEDEQIRRANAYAQKLQAATQPAAKPPAQAAAGAAAGLPPIWRP